MTSYQLTLDKSRDPFRRFDALVCLNFDLQHCVWENTHILRFQSLPDLLGPVITFLRNTQVRVEGYAEPGITRNLEGRAIVGSPYHWPK